MASLTDAEIRCLIGEPKPHVDARDLLSELKEQNRHRRASVKVAGRDGSRFELTVRQSTLNANDFSAILTHITDAGRAINLLRYNGSNHVHRNFLEGDTCHFVAHIHRATQRYQDAGRDAEGHATATQDYTDLGGALNALLVDANFETPAQGSML